MTKRYKIGLLLLGISIILVIFSNVIIGNVISTVINSQIKKINYKGEVTLKVDKIFVDVFTGNLTLKKFSIKPDSLFFENFKLGKTHKAVVSDFYLSELRIEGINIVKILFHKEILVQKIKVSNIDLNIYKSDIFISEPKKIEQVKKQSFDSIYIKGIEQIDLSNIEFDDFNIKIFNVQKNDTLFAYSGNEFNINGIELKHYDNAKNYFKFNKDSLRINFKKQELDLEEGNYKLTIEDIAYDFPKKTIKFSNFKMKPSIDCSKLAATYKYNSEVFDVETKEISLNGFYLDSVIRNGVVDLDSVIVDGVNLSIYKDQTKPFNLKKRPLFLNQQLKKLDHPIYINKVLIKNTFFSYREKHEGKMDLLAIDISNINASLNHVTSIKDSLIANKELSINIKGKLNKVADLNLDVFMSYNTWNDSFSFIGRVGSAKFNVFNSALFPAAGIKFEDGRLNSMQFFVNGNPRDGTEGSMTMTYSNINATFIKEKKEKKAISWIANTAIVESNPSKKGHLKIALIEAERVPYKGFWNLVWKSVMSGMVNTINPVGKTVKIQNENKKNQQIRHKEKKG